MKNTVLDITLGIASSCIKSENRLKHIWLIANWHRFLPIVAVFIAPKEVIVVPRFKHYIWISFDYIPSRDEREIIKISEEYYCSHFKELISLN